MGYIEKLNSMLVGRLVHKRNDLDFKVRILQLNNNGTALVKFDNKFGNVSFFKLMNYYVF